MSSHNLSWNTSVFMRVFLTDEHTLIDFADMLPYLSRISIGDDSTRSNELYSWKVENSLFVTIFKHIDLNTYVYVHSLEKLFGVTEYLYLDEYCPVGSVFIGQMSIDNFDHMTHKFQYDDIRINLLVFDMIRFGTTCYQEVRPIERYNKLRECATSCFSPDRNVILQW